MSVDLDSTLPNRSPEDCVDMLMADLAALSNREDR